jgi:hypothetical protein
MLTGWFLCCVHSVMCQVTVDGVLDCQLELLDYQSVTLSYSAHILQLTTVDHSTRLATAPQPVFHCNHSYGIPCQHQLNTSASKQASSSLLLAFASMVILGVEPHWDP